MKKLALLASLAVVATASAASLKTPDEVSRSWNQTVAETTPPAARDFSLRGQSSPGPLNLAPSAPQPMPFRASNPKPRIREPLYDAPGPGYRVPDVLPDNLPPGAKPWNYDGRTYWLIPIKPAINKIP